MNGITRKTSSGVKPERVFGFGLGVSQDGSVSHAGRTESRAVIEAGTVAKPSENGASQIRCQDQRARRFTSGASEIVLNSSEELNPRSFVIQTTRALVGQVCSIGLISDDPCR